MLVYIAFTPSISFATYSTAASIGCNQFRTMPDIISKLSCATICSCHAVQFKSELTHRTACWFRSAALHRILFRICCFVSFSYFYSETNEWLKDWAKQWALLWLQQLLATSIKNFISHETKKWLVTASHKNWWLNHIPGCHCPKFTKHQNLFDSWTESVSQEWKHVFLKRLRAFCWPQLLKTT